MTEAERLVEGARRTKHLVSIAALLLIVAAILGAFAVIVNFIQSGDISRIERSACGKDPTSLECKRISRESAEARSIRDTCIAFWKVGYACPRPNSGVSIPTTGGGGASQPANAGQPSAPAPAGDKGGQDTGGGQGPRGSQPEVDKPDHEPGGDGGESPSESPKAVPGPAGPAGPAGPVGAPGTSAVEPEPEPGVLDPVLGKVCEATQPLQLCNR